MKKILFATVAFMSAFLCSCDNDDISVIRVPEGVNTVQYVDAVNNICKLPIQSEGEWIVSKNETDNWIYLISKGGIGDGNVQLSLGTNLTE